MAIVLINEIPTEVGSGADEIIRLRKELAAAQVDAKRRIEAAWRDGYRSLSTYNDVDVSDEETCWKKSSTYDAIAKEQSLEKACRRAEWWKAEHLAGNIRIAELEALVSTREDDIRTEKMWVQRHAERIATLEEAAREARERFDKLARFGNEPHYGNSFGNQIAFEGIAKLDAVLGNA